MEDLEVEDPQEEAEEDVIDIALSKLVDKVVQGDDEDEWEYASDLLFDIVGDLVDDEKITDIPEEDAPDEEKEKWLENSLPAIEEALRETLGEE